MTRVLYRRALSRAAEILGSEERLAHFLDAEQKELRGWKHGGQPPVAALQLVAALLKQRLLEKYRARS